MKHAFTAFACLLISGCYTTEELRQRTPDATVEFTTGWNEAALCTIREMDSRMQAPASIREYKADNYAEVIAPTTGGDQTAVIIEFRDQEPGRAVGVARANPALLGTGWVITQAKESMEACVS